MASFWENFAEAMGWGKANHTKHLSDISEEKRQEYRDRNADAAVKRGEESSKLEISDAKNTPGKMNYMSKGDFNSDWNDDTNYETRVYKFSYAVPTNANMDESQGPESWKGNSRRSGMALVRVPKRRSSTTTLGFPAQYFNDDDRENLKGQMGVYEAFLDDGTVLNAKEFKDLVYANPYSTPDGPGFKWEGLNTKGSNALNHFKFQRDQRQRLGTPYYNDPNSFDHNIPRWDTNWRRWVKR